MASKSDFEEYPFMGAKIVRYDVTVNSSINHEIRIRKNPERDEKVYTSNTTLKIDALCNSPDEFMDYKCSMSIFGQEQYKCQFSSELKDHHKRDERWNLMYKKTKDGEMPVYDIPSGIGYIEKYKKEKHWHGAVWIQPQITTDMLVLLSRVNPLYIDLHLQKAIKRGCWSVLGLSLKTEDPRES